MTTSTTDVLPLRRVEGHYFLVVAGELWLLDTGAPSSFGHRTVLDLAGHSFTIDEQYVGLTPDSLSEFVGVACAGLLGNDILSQFDLLLDADAGQARLASADVTAPGEALELDAFMGIPITSVKIGGSDYRFFFDTGAQLSYFQDASLSGFPRAGRISDFYPGFGSFETETYQVGVALGSAPFVLRCGSLPGLLGATLMMAGTSGIVGNEVLESQIVLYAPRRHLLSLIRNGKRS